MRIEPTSTRILRAEGVELRIIDIINRRHTAGSVADFNNTSSEWDINMIGDCVERNHDFVDKFCNWFTLYYELD